MPEKKYLTCERGSSPFTILVGAALLLKAELTTPDLIIIMKEDDIEGGKFKPQDSVLSIGFLDDPKNGNFINLQGLMGYLIENNIIYPYVAGAFMNSLKDPEGVVFKVFESLRHVPIHRAISGMTMMVSLFIDDLLGEMLSLLRHWNDNTHNPGQHQFTSALSLIDQGGEQGPESI